MIFEFEPGDIVINPINKNWGVGQVQSVINNKITINFENVGKKVINAENIKIERYNKNEHRK
jgi:transcription elongation factor GreA-like protein